MNVPKLRFKEFDGEWAERKLIDNAEKVLDYRGKSPTKFGMNWGNEGYLVLSALNVKDGYIDKSVDAKYGNQELLERWMGDYRLVEGDVLFTTEAPLGNVAQVPDNNGYILNQRAVAFKTSEGTDNNFFAHLLRNPSVQNKLYANASGGTAKGIGMKEFAKLTSYVPKIDEQKKIGLLFKKLDEKIQLQQQKIDLLQEQKTGYMQKIFRQDLRFKGFVEKWENKSLESVVERITRKNKNLESNLPLTISAEKGLVDQITYFNKNVSGKDLAGYYLLKRGEFAYNKSYSNGYPWGAIKRLENYEMGVLSTLYICFKTTNINDEFLKHYFETTHWHKEVSMIAAEGARNHGLLNIPVTDFFKIKITIPSEEEQEKIAKFFNVIEEKLNLEQAKLLNLKKQKQGFMQQMFI